MKWIWQKLGILDDGNLRSTERVMITLLALGGAMVLVILIFGVLRAIGQWDKNSLWNSAGFVFWSLTAAFVAFLFGGLVGMLFGLPTARHVEITSGNAAGGQESGAPAPVSSGYVESTSLEQIADALVKGLVVLSLATFDAWVRRFETLAANLTATMMGSPACPAGVDCVADRVPGGLLLAGFATLGFLVGYLWMRRWFIAEMVAARIGERDALNKEKQQRAAEQRTIEAARTSGLAGTGTSQSNNTGVVQAQAQQMAATVAASAPATARDGATLIEQQVTTSGPDPDDPWKGAFGGSAVNGGCSLSATVTALKSDENYFQVDLLVSVVDPERRAELAGKAAHYYLHPSFGAGTKDVVIGPDGTAPLQLFSYGGFTVGVLIDDGTTLEFDLAKIPGAPAKFTDR